MAKKSSNIQKLAQDFIAELNAPMGRYIPSWIAPHPDNLGGTKHAVRKRNIRVNERKTPKEEKAANVSKGQAKSKTKKTNEKG
tara:strand:- start:668 stop:916 length:249 start_codon:yes stop_codon:yes gene_type:complete